MRQEETPSQGRSNAFNLVVDTAARTQAEREKDFLDMKRYIQEELESERDNAYQFVWVQALLILGGLGAGYFHWYQAGFFIFFQGVCWFLYSVIRYQGLKPPSTMGRLQPTSPHRIKLGNVLPENRAQVETAIKLVLGSNTVVVFEP